MQKYKKSQEVRPKNYKDCELREKNPEKKGYETTSPR